MTYFVDGEIRKLRGSNHLPAAKGAYEAATTISFVGEPGKTPGVREVRTTTAGHVTNSHTNVQA